MLATHLRRSRNLALSRTCPQDCLPDGIPEGKVEFCFTRRLVDWFVRPINICISLARIALPAAMVFEEAARLSYQLRQLWPQASALTPKAPAPPKFSLLDAQTHRL